MDLANISNRGWIVILVLGVLALGVIAFLIWVLWNILNHKNVKTKFFETSNTEMKRDLYMAEGKDQLDNQCQVAKQILKQLRILIFERGVKVFDFPLDSCEFQIWELITYRIVDRINFDVRNDLVRNHIIRKTDDELMEYTKAKACGYMALIRDRLYLNNSRLRGKNLPDVMNDIPTERLENIFKEVYFSARSITGVNGNSNNNSSNK